MYNYFNSRMTVLFIHTCTVLTSSCYNEAVICTVHVGSDWVYSGDLFFCSIRSIRETEVPPAGPSPGRARPSHGPAIHPSIIEGTAGRRPRAVASRLCRASLAARAEALPAIYGSRGRWPLPRAVRAWPPPAAALPPRATPPLNPARHSPSPRVRGHRELL